MLATISELGIPPYLLIVVYLTWGDMNLHCTNYALLCVFFVVVFSKKIHEDKKSECNVRKWSLWVFKKSRFNEKHKLNSTQG